MNAGAWRDTVSKLEQLDTKYKVAVDKALQGLIEVIVTAENTSHSNS